jgi:molybdopterin synthase sulfur carrier subunit
MPVTVFVPTPLRPLFGNISTVEVDAETVGGLIDVLEERYPGFRSRVCEESGELRRFINIYVEGEDIRFLDSLSTRVPAGAEISIVPAIAGG